MLNMYTMISACVCQVSVSGMPGDVLDGEVCRLTVEVVNCGQVPLNSLRLTSSAGGQLLLDPVSLSRGISATEIEPLCDSIISLHVHVCVCYTERGILWACLPFLCTLNCLYLVPTLPYLPAATTSSMY